MFSSTVVLGELLLLLPLLPPVQTEGPGIVYGLYPLQRLKFTSGSVFL